MMSDEWKRSVSAKSLGRIGFLGGLGGAINAWLCLAKLPVPVGSYPDFSWPIIPAGALHGALLALVTIQLTAGFVTRSRGVRWFGLFVTGWVVGWLSFIPIQLYVHGAPIIATASSTPLTLKGVGEALVWPFQWELSSLWAPYQGFGLVGVCYYVLCLRCGGFARQRRSTQVLAGILSGSLGSLWWWITYQPWYLSLLHGTIWGSLVGFGIWTSQRAAPASPD